jgi:hypothetical protein
MSVGKNTFAQQGFAGHFEPGPSVKVEIQRSSFTDAEWSGAIQALQCLQEPRADLYGLLGCDWINIDAV